MTSILRPSFEKESRELGKGTGDKRLDRLVHHPVPLASKRAKEVWAGFVVTSWCGCARIRGRETFLDS